MMSSKILQLLSLRLLQSKRILDSVGYLLLIVFCLVIVGIFASALSNLLLINRWWAIIAFLVMYFSIERYRSDKSFLRSIFIGQCRLGFFLGLEYLLLTTPLIVAQLILGNWMVVLALIGSALLGGFTSTYLKHEIKSGVKTELSQIPLDYFEFKFVVESAPYTSLCIWLFGLLSYLHIGLYLIWILLLIMLLQTFFLFQESRDMLHWHPNFLMTKFKKYIGITSLVTLLPTIMTLVFHSDSMLIIFYALFCLFTGLFMTLVFKYASYTPLRPMSQVSSIASVFIILMIIPGGAIITLVYAIFKYYKAEKNLKSLYA